MERLDASFLPEGRLPLGSSQGCATTNARRVGHSRFQPEYTSSMVLPPVMTILPEKKHSRTTGEDSGRKMSPGNILRWYVQFRAIWAYMPCRSRNPSPIGISTCATMFCTSQVPRLNVCPGMHSCRSPATKRDAYTHWYHVRHPVTTSLPDEKSSVVQSGWCRRTVMAANLLWS